MYLLDSPSLNFIPLVQPKWNMASFSNLYCVQTLTLSPFCMTSIIEGKTRKITQFLCFSNAILSMQSIGMVKQFTKQRGWRFECSNGCNITIIHEFFYWKLNTTFSIFSSFSSRPDSSSAIGSTATISGIFSIKRRSMPIFIVITELGQEPQAPCSFNRTTLPSISCNATFPPSAIR